MTSRVAHVTPEVVSQSRWSSLPVAAFFAALGASAVFLVFQARHLWFFGDDWDFLLRRGITGDPHQSIWEPHNEHWSTLPILCFRMLYSAFGMRSYLPYALLVIALHVGVTCLLWGLLRRAGVRPWISAGFGAIVGLMAAGAENTLWDFQIGFVGSVFFGLLALRLQTDARGLGRNVSLASLSVVAGLMCSGQGLTMLLVVALYGCLLGGLIVGLTPAAVGMAAYLTWFGLVGHTGMNGGLDSPLQLPEYVWTGLGHVWESMTGVPGIGLLSLAAACAWVVRQRGRAPGVGRALAASGLVGAVVLYAMVALTRAHFGLGMATTGRYAYTAAVLTCPALALTVQAIIGPRASPGPAPWTIATTLMGLVGLAGVNTIIDWRVARAEMLSGVPQRVVGAWQLLSQDPEARLLRMRPGSKYDTQLDIGDLLAAGRDGKLPDLGRNPNGVLDAAATLQVNVAPTSLVLPAPRTLTTHGIALERRWNGTECVRGRSGGQGGWIEFPVVNGGVAVAVTTAGTELGTQLVSPHASSAVETWPVTPHVGYSVGSTAAARSLRIVLSRPTTFLLCP